MPMHLKQLAVAALATCAALALAPSPASAAPVFPTAADDASGLVMHSAPNTASPRTGSVPAGARVAVLCQTSGQRLSDPKYGTTTLWDSVQYGGRTGYVTDLYVLTNADRIPGVPGCGAAAPVGPILPPAGAPAESVAGGPIARQEVLNRSTGWIRRGVMYSQSAYTDGYRRDCSGYVSLAWHLRGSPNSTALRSSRHTVVIPARVLQPGDALGRPGHIALFVRWTPDGRPVVREEYDYGHPATEHAWSRRYAATFTAYRYRNIR